MKGDHGVTPARKRCEGLERVLEHLSPSSLSSHLRLRDRRQLMPTKADVSKKGCLQGVCDCTVVAELA